MMILVMSLKIENRKLLVKVLAWSLAAIAILAVVLRIEFFELEYYGSKEGSERAVVAEPVEVGAVEIEELIEEIIDGSKMVFVLKNVIITVAMPYMILIIFIVENAQKEL